MNQIIEIPIEKLSLNPLNSATRTPDKEFVQSIKDKGIKVPLAVRKNGSNDTYVINAGQRRFLAAKEVGLKTCPCILETGNLEENNTLLLVDNIHRKNMNLWEEHLVIAELLKKSNVAEVAKKLGKTSSYVIRRSNLSNLIPVIQKALQDEVQGLTDKIVFLLAKLPDSIQRSVYSYYIREAKLNDKNVQIFDADENAVVDYIQDKLNDELFTLSPLDTLKVFGSLKNIGKKTPDQVAKNLFSETVDTQKVSEEDIKATKALLKQINNAVKLSTNRFVYEGCLSSEQWREPLPDDAPELIQDGIVVDGKNQGKLQKFVKVDKKKEEKKKVNDIRTPAQVEKAKKERKEVILSNKSHYAALNKLCELSASTKVEIDKDFVKFYVSVVMNHSSRTSFLRNVLTEEEYKDTGYNKVEENIFKILKKASLPTPARELQYLMLVSEVSNRYEDIAGILGVKFETVKKECRKVIDTEIEAKKKEKLAKKGKKK